MAQTFTIQCTNCQWEVDIEAENLRDAKEQAEIYACDRCEEGDMRPI